MPEPFVSFFEDAARTIHVQMYREVTQHPPRHSDFFITDVEGMLLGRWSPLAVQEAWVSQTPLNVAYRNPVAAVEEQLRDAAYFNKDYLGKYYAYDPGQRRAVWTKKPDLIAREMNHSKIFDFYVSPVHVQQAQEKLK